MNLVGPLGRVIERFLTPVARNDAQDAQVSPQDTTSPHRFEQIVRSITVGVITVDAGGHVTSLNAAAAEIFDISCKLALGRAMIEIVPCFPLDQRVHETLEGNPSRGTIEIMIRGNLRSLRVTTLPIDDEPGAIVIVSDETRLHELEQIRREFVANVAHELRTPLTSIKLMVETIGDNPDDEEARILFVPRIRSEVDRMVDLLEDLLDVARAEAGQLALRREDFDLHALAESTLKTFEPRAEALGILLHSSGGPAEISGACERVTQVIVNLIDNALRHTSAHGTVTVHVENVESVVRLVVSDTGIGIPYNDLPHIFERFYVVDRSRARESGGTGLGLSIVKHIVEAHGGSVTVDSELGQGAVFTCIFPSVRTTT